MTIVQHTKPEKYSTLLPKLSRLKYMSRGKRIREARNAKQLTQLELAERVGVTKSSVSQWEADAIKKMESENLLALSRVLSVDVNWIAFGKTSVAPGRGPEISRAEEIYEIISGFNEEQLSQLDAYVGFLKEKK